MPTGINEYKRHCARCKRQYLAKMGSQKYCSPCARYIRELRALGFMGNWSQEDEDAFRVGRGLRRHKKDFKYLTMKGK